MTLPKLDDSTLVTPLYIDEVIIERIKFFLSGLEVLTGPHDHPSKLVSLHHSTTSYNYVEKSLKVGHQLIRNKVTVT